MGVACMALNGLICQYWYGGLLCILYHQDTRVHLILSCLFTIGNVGMSIYLCLQLILGCLKSDIDCVCNVCGVALQFD